MEMNEVLVPSELNMSFRNRMAYHQAPTNQEDHFVENGEPGRRRVHWILSNYWRQMVFIFTPIALLPLVVIHGSLEYRAAYTVALMAVYWLTEAIPLAVTALIPVVLYPLLGVASSYELCPNYMKEVMMLTVSSLFLGVAMEAHNMHKRIALKLLLVIGTGPKRLLLGFLCCGTLLSMVTTNCATATMMVPVAKAVLSELQYSQIDRKAMLNKTPNGTQPVTEGHTDLYEEQAEPAKTEDTRPLYIGCLLAVAYGTSIGGTGTLTGGAPNLILKSFMDEKYTTYKMLTFSTWTLYNLPSMILALLSTWTVLFCIYVRKSKSNDRVNDKVRDFLTNKYSELGPLMTVEKVLGILFAVLTFLWYFRTPGFTSGWGDAIPWGDMIGNATPSVLISVLLFVIPCSSKKDSPVILDWKTAQEHTPWGVILLLGGGLALAHGAKKSGLMDLIADNLLHLKALSPFFMLFALCLLTLLTTEFLSNTSTASLFIPVIDQLARTLGLHPLFLLLPVTICCSYAFMLPMATSPNAIVYQNSTVKTAEMAWPGLFLNILCCCIQVGAIYVLGHHMFSLDTPITNTTAVFNNASLV